MGVRVEEYAYYVNKFRQNVGLETWLWRDVKLWRHKQWTPNTNAHHTPLNETPHENFLRTPLSSGFYRCDVNDCINLRNGLTR